jgi:hypothetical protein
MRLAWLEVKLYRGGGGAIAPERFFFARMIRDDREALEAAAPGRKMRRFVENRWPTRKNCGFDVTKPDKLTFTWDIKKKPLF